MIESILGRLLVVDDEIDTLTPLCDLLSEWGYEVEGFTSGKDALEAFKEQTFDLLLTDLVMSEMDGIELLQTALEIDPNLVGIIITGKGTIQTVVEAMKVGAFDYVLKPLDWKMLRLVLSRAIEVRRLRMENLQLSETMEIYELCQAIAFTQDLNTILNKVADTAIQQLKANEASIMLLTPEGNELYIVVVRGENRESLLWKHVPIEQGIAGWVARYHEPLTLNGMVADHRFKPIKPRAGIRSAISMPLLVGGKILGVLNVNSAKQRRPFTLGQVKALSILASHAASVLESAQLYTQVREAGKKYRTLFEESRDTVYITTREGKFIDINHAGLDIFGYTKEEMTELKAKELYVDPAERDRFQQEIEQKGSVRDYEVKFHKKDGTEMDCLLTSTLRLADDGNILGYQGIIHDITERKRAEEELKKAYIEVRETQEELIRLEKLAALGRFSSGIAHEIRNPLANISAAAQFCLAKYKLDGEFKKHLRLILRNSKNANKIIEELLDLSKPVEFSFELDDVGKLINRICGQVKTRCYKQSVRLYKSCSNELPEILIAEKQLERVFLNFILNAIDAMPDGGSLTISAYPVSQNNEVVVSFLDTGCGIPQENLDKVFEPFFTTKDDGVGLGLSLAHQIINFHKGKINIESEVGKGTNVVVSLPISRKE